MKQKYHPILFSTPMVYAILNGNKAQTRRIMNPQPTAKTFSGIIGGYDDIPRMARFYTLGKPNEPIIEDIKLKYNIGDILWVRETFQHTKILNINPEDENYGYVYRASENGEEFEKNTDHWTWKPNMFMPKEACRLFLEVVSVRVEQLNRISDDDCLAEGIKKYEDELFGYLFHNYNKGDCLQSKFNSPQQSYKSLWENINGTGSWEKNPYVWVYDFDIIKKPKNFK
jgi:hypothetical protein